MMGFASDPAGQGVWPGTGFGPVGGALQGAHTPFVEIRFDAGFQATVGGDDGSGLPGPQHWGGDQNARLARKKEVRYRHGLPVAMVAEVNVTLGAVEHTGRGRFGVAQ